MTTKTKRTAALELLANTGLQPSHYAPPLWRLFWRLGIDAPPPHFSNFFVNAVVSGAFFGTVWGAIMWLAVWSQDGVSLRKALAAAGAAGLMFGLAIATNYLYARRKYALPAWRDVGA